MPAIERRKRGPGGQPGAPWGLLSGPVSLTLLPPLPFADFRLADLLTGQRGGERPLQQLEAANAFVVSLDARRSWETERVESAFAEMNDEQRDHGAMRIAQAALRLARGDPRRRPTRSHPGAAPSADGGPGRRLDAYRTDVEPS